MAASRAGLHIVRASRVGKTASDAELLAEANQLKNSGAQAVYLLMAPVNFIKCRDHAGQARLLAGAGGLIYALYQTTVWFFQGFESGLLAFTAAVMGGIGNIRGAVLGGLIIGVIQSLTDSRLGPQWTEAVVFGYLIAIMVLRPRGLLGEETREAG